ncbi:epoxide hydrolase [Gautieria morchelliformis]|nr:epoxide hydrolase [Gautieria morchelliformis]
MATDSPQTQSQARPSPRSEPTPFQIHVPEERLVRLKRKLEDYELPEKDIVDDAGWSYGVSLEWVKELRKYWLDEYDWRKAEAHMNRWDHFKVEIESVDLHYVYQRSSRPDAIPLLIVHGWPGSFYEFDQIVEPLANPSQDQPAFHVIVPSVPGFGFSSTPRVQGWTVKDTARVLDKLMTEVLGFKTYAAQGGDWGSIISTLLSNMPSCKAIHHNMSIVPPPFSYVTAGLMFMLPKWLSSRLISWHFSPEEHRQMLRSKDFALQAGGYFGVQSRQPFTLGLALNDSPIGILIWIGEKYHAHTDPSFNLPPHILLTTISIYYHTHTFASSCLPYHENTALIAGPTPRITDSVLGVSIFEHDIMVLPKEWVSKWHKQQLVFHKSHAKGGHFPALDNPEGLVADLREFLGMHQALLKTVA